MSHPVADLRAQGIALRAAMEACAHNPKTKPVHNLRTASRRIQAQLELLPLLLDVPHAPHAPRIKIKFKRESKAFLKAARKIRHAAGIVRDLDVHADHLATLRSPNPSAKAARTLAKDLEPKREKAAAKLQQTLHKHHSKLLDALNDLETALLPAAELELTPPQANHLAEHWFTRHTADLNPQKPADLHDLRKAAKLARYIAETAAPPSRSKKSASPVARHFNQIQQTTGDWHDWLALTEVAAHHLKASSPLVPTLERRRDQAHLSALTLIRPNGKPARKHR